MGPVSDWHLLGVIALGHAHLQLIIGCSLQAPPRSMLDHKLLVLHINAHWYSVLRLHDLAANCVLVVVHWLVHCHVCRFKHSLFATCSLRPILLCKFLSHAV